MASNESASKVGLVGLIAIVVGGIVGGGIFSIPQNMAAPAALGPILVAWAITFVGMLLLTFVFKGLADARPDLNTGLQTYAQVGFGEFAGFLVAWSYWVSAMLGNVAFAVLIPQTLGYWYPVLLKSNNWQTVLIGSAFFWAYLILVLRGVRGATLLNNFVTVAKFLPILVFVAILCFAGHWSHLSLDFWGGDLPKLGDVFVQAKGTMLVTLWQFIGIEGAVVIASRAKKPADIGKATVISLFLCTAFFVAISVLPFKVQDQPGLAAMSNPSSAYIMKALVGGWGADLMNIGLLVSVIGCWLVWTLLTAEVPYRAAQNGLFPKAFLRTNSQDVPSFSLWLTTILSQALLFMALFTANAWNFMIQIAGVMILPAYLVAAMYYCKVAHDHRHGLDNRAVTIGRHAFSVGLGGTLYAIWLIYAAGLNLIYLSTLFLVAGNFVYGWMRRKEQMQPGERVYPHGYEAVVAGLLLALALSAVVLLSTGRMKIGS